MQRLIPLFLAATLLAGPALAATTAPSDDPLITLNLPENVELKTLVDYASQRLGFNVIYDDSIANQRVTLKLPDAIPRSSLLGLVESALRTKGFTLAQGDQPGWRRVVPAANLSAVATPTTQAGGDVSAVVRVFSLNNADAARVDQAIKPFLTQPGGNSLGIPEQRLLIVSDYAANMRRIEELVKMIDAPHPDVVVEVVTLQNTEADSLSRAMAGILMAQAAAQGGIPGAPLTGDKVEVTPEPHSNRIAIVGSRARVEQAVQLVRSMDQPPAVETRTYAFAYASPDRVDKLMKDLLGADAKRQYTSAVDKDGGLLVVTAPPQVQARVEQLKLATDRPSQEGRSPVRFYKLSNATAADVLDTIRGIEGESSTDTSSATASGPMGAASDLSLGSGPAAAPRPSAQQSFPANNTPAFGATANAITPSVGSPLQPSANTDYVNGSGTNSSGQSQIQAVHTRYGTVTADVNTNSIIVVGDPEQQRFYETLIPLLDKRRPQVLIEATIVSVDTTNNFQFGVEIGVKSGSGATKILNFSSFGLSTVDATNGQLAITPGTGFNGTILNSDVASAVLHALATDTRARVLSSPRLLVNDNSDGTLNSTDNVPFASINASNTVSTTSLGGTVSAGTIIKVTPHISEGDHLALHYDVTLSSFNGSSSANLPPPTKSDELASDVTIPDGDTVVVGGLHTKSDTFTRDAIPVLGQIPILEYLFSNRTVVHENATLFVFIRPVILRDDEFRDLKFLSSRDVQRAAIPGDYPSSEPIAIR